MASSEVKVQEQTYNIMDFVDAEAELQELKAAKGIVKEENPVWWQKLGDKYVAYKDNIKPIAIKKRKYCLAALFLGWLGVHKFMTGKKITGILYILVSWTGASFVLSVLDIFQAAFMKADENNCIIV